MSKVTGFTIGEKGVVRKTPKFEFRVLIGETLFTAKCGNEPLDSQFITNLITELEEYKVSQLLMDEWQDDSKHEYTIKELLMLNTYYHNSELQFPLAYYDVYYVGEFGTSHKVTPVFE